MTKEDLKKIVSSNKAKWTKDIENKVKVKTEIHGEDRLIGKGSNYEIILLWSYFTGPALNVHTTIELLIQEQAMEKNDVVKFKKFLEPGDDKLKMVLLEDPDGGRVLVKALAGMAINPTNRYNVDELELIDPKYDYQVVEGIKQNNFKKKIAEKSGVGVNDLKNIFSNISIVANDFNMSKIASYLKKSHPFWNTLDYVKALEDAVQKVLPKSYVDCIFSKNLGKSITLYVTLGAKGETQVTLHNDPMYHVISINTIPYDNFPDDGELPEKLSAECSMGGLMVTPAKGSMYAFDRVKTGWRNKTSTPDGILNYIVEYFKKVKNIVKENKDRLPKNLGDKY